MHPVALGNTDAAGSPEELAAVRHLVALGYQDPLDLAARRLVVQREQRRLLDQAEGLVRAQQAGAAIELLGPAIISDADWSAGRHVLARACVAARRFDDAAEQLRWLELHAIEHVELSLLRAGVALHYRRFDEAREHALYARCLRSPLPEADVLLGEATFHRGDLASAEAAFRRANDAAPANAAAALGIAAVRLRRRCHEEAVDWALHAVERDAGRWQAHYCLGCALAGLGLLAEARLAIEQSVRLQPHAAAPYRRLLRAWEASGDAPAVVAAQCRRQLDAIRQQRALEHAASTRAAKDGGRQAPSVAS